jgi:hypothetical protein
MGWVKPLAGMKDALHLRAREKGSKHASAERADDGEGGKLIGQLHAVNRKA